MQTKSKKFLNTLAKRLFLGSFLILGNLENSFTQAIELAKEKRSIIFKKELEGWQLHKNFLGVDYIFLKRTKDDKQGGVKNLV
jgi:hypothetical protein